MEVIGLLIGKYGDEHVPELEEGCILRVEPPKAGSSNAPAAICPASLGLCSSVVARLPVKRLEGFLAPTVFVRGYRHGLLEGF